jgi:hypothetical protein
MLTSIGSTSAMRLLAAQTRAPALQAIANVGKIEPLLQAKQFSAKQQLPRYNKSNKWLALSQFRH